MKEITIIFTQLEHNIAIKFIREYRDVFREVNLKQCKDFFDNARHEIEMNGRYIHTVPYNAEDVKRWTDFSSTVNKIEGVKTEVFVDPELFKLDQHKTNKALKWFGNLPDRDKEYVELLIKRGSAKE